MAQVAVENLNSCLVIVIKGAISEASELPAVKLNGAHKVIIDLKNVVAINSLGIKAWMQWIEKFNSPTLTLIVKNVPKCIVIMANAATNFFPENCQIHSVYVPFFAEESQSVKQVLYTAGQELQKDQVAHPYKIVCDETNEIMQPDVIDADYFKFLKKYELAEEES